MGRLTIGIDADDCGAGAAGRNGGFLLAGMADFYHDEVKKLGRDYSRTRYLETIEELNKFYDEYPGIARKCGSLRIAETDEEMKDCTEQYNAMKADNLPVEWYDGPEGKGLLMETDGVFNPMARVRSLAQKVINLGARLYGKTRAMKVTGNSVLTD